MQPQATKRDFDVAFEGLDFPVSLSEIRRYAKDRGGISREVDEIIGLLGRDSYDSLEQLLQDIREAYVQRGVPPDELPV